MTKRDKNRAVILKNVSFSYVEKECERKILSDFSMSFCTGTITSILGSSGCGKSTLLNLIGNNRKINDGRIFYSNEINENKDIGIVFQENILLPWKSVEKNLDFALKTRVFDKEHRKKIIKEYLAKFNMVGAEALFPYQLSGGMYARVILIRALILQPKLVLVDEAFSALDLLTKNIIIEQFLREIHENKRTAIVITHDIFEALKISDRVVVLQGEPLRTILDIELDQNSEEQKSQVKERLYEILIKNM